MQLLPVFERGRLNPVYCSVNVPRSFLAFLLMVVESVAVPLPVQLNMLALRHVYRLPAVAALQCSVVSALKAKPDSSE